MIQNSELAKLLGEMAELLEVTGGNRFKVLAHQRAAETVRQHPYALADYVHEQRDLTEIDGIGKGIAEKITEFVEQGRIAELDTLREKVPPGVIQIMRIPGVGPKTAANFWKKANVLSVDALRQRIDAGELRDLPRMGEKSLKKIRDAIAFVEAAGQRHLIHTAMDTARMMLERLRDQPGVRLTEYAGSLRRGCETIGDLDLLVACDDPKTIATHFTQMPEVDQILGQGERKTSVRLKSGLQVDMRLVREAQFGAALMYFTGSKQHNVALRQRAIKRNMILNEYGLWPAADEGEAEQTQEHPAERDPAEAIACDTEQNIYQALELNYIAPELREARGEIEAAENDQLPELITLEDIRCELHAHTLASDGVMRIEELAEQALSRGFHSIAITDHSRSQVQANGLSIERLTRHIEDIRKIASQYDKLNIYAGAEVDILSDGTLDYPDELLAELDMVVASPHAALSQDRTTATQRMIRAIENPYVHVIGHMTGRLIARRPGLEIDMPKIAQAATQTGTALEINANPHRLDLKDIDAKTAIDAGAKLAIHTDAHSPIDLDLLCYGVLCARRAWASKDDVINTMSKSKLKNWLKAKRKAMGVA